MLCCVLIIIVLLANALLLCRVGCGMNPDLTCAVTKRAYIGQRQTAIALVNSVMQSNENGFKICTCFIPGRYALLEEGYVIVCL